MPRFQYKFTYVENNKTTSKTIITDNELYEDAIAKFEHDYPDINWQTITLLGRETILHLKHPIL